MIIMRWWSLCVEPSSMVRVRLSRCWRPAHNRRGYSEPSQSRRSLFSCQLLRSGFATAFANLPPSAVPCASCRGLRARRCRWCECPRDRGCLGCGSMRRRPGACALLWCGAGCAARVFEQARGGSCGQRWRVLLDGPQSRAGEPGAVPASEYGFSACARTIESSGAQVVPEKAHRAWHQRHDARLASFAGKGCLSG